MPEGLDNSLWTTEEQFPCGYGPRALHLSYDLEALFVGSKDGSIRVVSPRQDNHAKKYESFLLEGCSGSGVRTLSEWQSGWLWIGRRGGEVEVVNVRSLSCKCASPVSLAPYLEDLREDSTHTLGRIDAERGFLSFQKRGTWVVHRKEIATDAPHLALETALAQRTELTVEKKPLCKILFIVPLGAEPEKFYLMASREGTIFVWDGNGTIVDRKPLWPQGEEPAFVNDVAVLWNDLERRARQRARGIFLATDRGVYLLHGRSKEFIQCKRLGLPGLGATCMAITYAEPKGNNCGYLWAVDSRGDSHLFRAEEIVDPAEMKFLPSGLFHAGSQSMRATSWYRKDESCLVVCQVKRDDQIVLTEYRAVRQGGSENSLAEIRRLLSQGNGEEIRAYWRVNDPQTGNEVAQWPAWAQLTELFEALAEKTTTLRALLEFLGAPSAEAAWNILEDTLNTPEPENESRRAVELWTLSLLGIINRTGGRLKYAERESGYLGIIRWLHNLREKASQAELNQELRGSLDKVFETSIGMVRKWGLFGEANAQRHSLTRSLAALRRQGGPEEDLDKLTYEALLLDRGLDLQTEDRHGNLPGRSAWDLSGQEIWGGFCFAVSWHWGRIELFELQQIPGKEPKLKRHGGIAPLCPQVQSSSQFRIASTEEITQDDYSQEIQRSQYGHSRAILLGKLSVGGRERVYLLTAPALPPQQQNNPEHLKLWEIVRKQDGLEFDDRSPYEQALPEKESVYSLLDLGSGWVLVGLLSQGGRASCLLLQIRETMSSYLEIDLHKHYYDDTESPLEPGDPKERSRNRVWSLAKVEPEPQESPESEEILKGRIKHQALLGCQDGMILLLTLIDVGTNKPFQAKWTRVARMSSAVKTLVCRRVNYDDSSALRIIAGGSNGSIVAWQELPPKQEANEKRFASLWAAYEGEEITGLHLMEIADKKYGKTRMVLGITRDERFVLFNDCEEVADLQLRRRPTRTPLPGCRHGSFQRSRQEPASAFATCKVPSLPLSLSPPFKDGLDMGQVAMILTASKHGVVRLLSLHYPHFQTARKQSIEDLLEDWRTIFQGEHQLRLVHAVYRTAPNLELVLVRELLDPAWVSGANPLFTDTLQPWMLPRNLRPLLKLQRAWASSERETINDGHSQEEKPVYDHLLAALREAFRLEDLLLFQEICEVVLQRGNRELFAQAGASDIRHQQAANTYLQMIEAIEQSIHQWQGGVNREESLARITVARNMVDGDTFLRILDAAAREERDALEEKVRKKEADDPAGPFGKVLHRRIRGVRELIIKGDWDSHVSLEALRAANLSMLRLCKRLEQKRKEDKGCQVLWSKVFEPYFQELTAAAARAFHSPLELNDALAHGYARTFALAVCACPSAAMRMATRMTETQLISNPQSKEDLAILVPLQFEILRQIGVTVPEHAQELFRIASSPPHERVDPLQDEWLLAHSDWEKFGEENYQDLLCIQRLYGLVNWFTKLEEILSSHPEALDTAWEDLEICFRNCSHEDVKKLYRHSFDFWCFAVQDFAKTLLDGEATAAAASQEEICQDLLRRLIQALGSEGDRDMRIRPRAVLLSRKIAGWARRMVGELRDRNEKLAIFQPESTIFNEVLDRLHRAAKSFPGSAAVRMSVVRGVLGHHLLEDLDEHILELQEIAHALDPLLVRQCHQDYRLRYRELGPETPLAQRFAMYLMTRSLRAESLPKNLRTLFSLLDRRDLDRAIHHSLEELLHPFRDRPSRQWEVDLQGQVNLCGKEENECLEHEEFHYLGLVLEELDLNAEKHPHRGDDTSYPSRATARIACTRPILLRISFEFPVTQEEREELRMLQEAWGEDSDRERPKGNLARLWTLRQNRLQCPIEPRPDRTVSSNGMGLYVANFAASIASWKLEIESVDYDSDSSQGRCVFELAKYE